jgi:DNA mismatch endonuclease (patch repair protein)
MADVHNKKTRSFNMSRIKGKDTKPEMLVRKYFFSKGFRYKLHDKKLAGKPDLVFPRLKTVIFIHGCYWHGHENCRYFVPPKTRTDWWLGKIGRNKQRDGENLAKLKTEGWNVITVFECELKPAAREATLSNLQNMLTEISDDTKN